MTEASFVLSIVSLGVAIAVAGVQLATFVYSGPRVRVEACAMRGVQIGDHSTSKTEPFLQIVVSCVGHVPVEVGRWAVRYPDDQTLHSTIVEMQYGSLPGVFLGDTLPALIAPGRSGSFNIPMVALETLDDRGLRMADGHLWVFFSARKTVKMKKTVAELIGSTRG